MLRRIKNKHFILVSFTCLLLICGVAFFVFNSPKTHAAGYELVAADPYANLQPTYLGQIIWSLKPYNNKLYVGFGDYGANTGPINIAPYDPNSNTYTSEWSADTEEIDNYTVINGKLYAPSTDPRTSADYSVGLPWTASSGVAATHNFGMTTLNGTDLWIGGSQDVNAVVWHSTNGGATWQMVLSIPPPASGDYVRFYFIGAYNGKIYVEADHGYNYSIVWDGTSWSHGPDIVSGWKADNFAGKMVLLSSENVRQGFKWFDGTQITRPAEFEQVHDYTISGSYLYIVDASCNVQRTQDLVNWETIGIGCPSSTNVPYSIGVLGNYVYIGTTGANIYRLALPSSPSSVPGDTNGDSHVNATDLSTLQANFNTTTASCDFNHDGTVNVFDFSILLSNYGT